MAWEWVLPDSTHGWLIGSNQLDGWWTKNKSEMFTIYRRKTNGCSKTPTESTHTHPWYLFIAHDVDKCYIMTKSQKPNVVLSFF